MASFKNIVKLGEFTFHPLINGLLTSIVLAVILSLAFGILLFVTPLQEVFLSTFANIIIAVSVFWGGRVTAKNIGSRGLLYGASVGLIFFTLSALIAVFNGGIITFTVVSKKILFCILAGALGGIAGVSEK